jgi:hypothetical protein
MKIARGEGNEYEGNKKTHEAHKEKTLSIKLYDSVRISEWPSYRPCDSEKTHIT